jgi:hypothetical protein
MENRNISPGELLENGRIVEQNICCGIVCVGRRICDGIIYAVG